MTPMTLERALEVAIEELASWGEPDVAGRPEAAAVLRAWLPFIKAAEAACKAGVLFHDAPSVEEADRKVDAYDYAIGTMLAAYRAAKEVTK